jgi:hypothetical protein
MLMVIGLLYPTIIMAQAGPRINEYEPSRAVLYGGNIGYTNADNGDLVYDLIVGYSQPVTDRLYLTGIAKTNFEDNSEYGMGIRPSYFLWPPRGGFNIFVTGGVGADWTDKPSLNGIVGAGIMKPGENVSPWLMLYVERDGDIEEFNIAIGILNMP